MTQEHPERPRQPDCFAAFKAGFMASGEGFNGEYRHGDPDLDAWLRERYDDWRASE